MTPPNATARSRSSAAAICKSLEHQHSAGEQTNGEFNNVIAAKQWAKEDEITCNVSRGTAIYFSDRLVHGSCTSAAGEERCAIINTYHAPAADDEFDTSFRRTTRSRRGVISRRYFSATNIAPCSP